MARFHVTSNSTSWAKAQSDTAKQIRFASVVALTRTANAIKTAEVATMRRVFDRPTPFTLNSLQVIPATKDKPEAVVETKQGFGSVPAGRFLSPEVYGGERRMKSSERKLGGYVVPSTFATLDQYGNVRGSTFVKILSQLKVLGQGADATNSKRSKRKRRGEAYFRRDNIIFVRKGQDITPALIVVEEPRYRQRLPFDQVAEREFNRVFPAEFDRAVSQAFATAR